MSSAHKIIRASHRQYLIPTRPNTSHPHGAPQEDTSLPFALHRLPAAAPHTLLPDLHLATDTTLLPLHTHLL